MIKRHQSASILIGFMAAAGLVLPSEIQAKTSYTLVNDYRLYTYSEYRAARQHNTTLQIRVIDERKGKHNPASHGKPLLETDEAFWMEPVSEMLERILMREIGLSFLFRKVERTDTRDGLVLEVALSTFHGQAKRVGALGRMIQADVAFSARLSQRKPRKTLFTKDYHSQATVKLKAIIESKRRAMVEQIGKALEEIVPVLMSDIERVLEKTRPPKKARRSTKKKAKPIHLEPVGPK